MLSGEISPGSSHILWFCTTHTLHFLSLTPRDEGRPQPRSAQPKKPPDSCLIISSANNNHRQQPPSTTSLCRCGRKALWHFLYDTQSLFFSSRKQRKCSLPSLTILFSPPWQGCLDFRFPLQWFSGRGQGYVLPSEAERNIRKKKKKTLGTTS